MKLILRDARIGTITVTGNEAALVYIGTAPVTWDITAMERSSIEALQGPVTVIIADEPVVLRKSRAKKLPEAPKAKRGRSPKGKVTNPGDSTSEATKPTNKMPGGQASKTGVRTLASESGKGTPESRLEPEKSGAHPGSAPGRDGYLEGIMHPGETLCDLCGYDAKTEGSLEAHKAMAHPEGKGK